MMSAHSLILRFISIFAVFTLCGSQVSAMEVRLVNGDRITGELVQSDESGVTLQTQSMGQVHIGREHIKPEETKTASEIAEAAHKWKGRVASGFSMREGNTESRALSLKVEAQKEVRSNILSVEAQTYYSSSEGKMNAQKWSAKARDDYDMGQTDHWYSFGEAEADRDRFADIDFRFTPAGGLGYFFFNNEDLILKVETGVGLTHTNFRSAAPSRTEAVLVPRLFVQKRLGTNSKLSEDLSIYPSLTESGEYRIKSETALNTPLQERLMLRLSLINELNSNPGPDTEKHDLKVISSLVYSL